MVKIVSPITLSNSLAFLIFPPSWTKLWYFSDSEASVLGWLNGRDALGMVSWSEEIVHQRQQCRPFIVHKLNIKECYLYLD